MDPYQLDPWSDSAFQLKTRETAYFLWEQDGKPEGKEQEYWFAALERGLRERDCDKKLAQTTMTDTEQTFER
ncbi:DUF2934 domain-containing protein [Devosia sp. MC521]|uniref:DUF2934 domain-containing protein n=1 Tax=Devosia sp. MC521 TaxID=2759954 RepID=UPI0032C0F8E0